MGVLPGQGERGPSAQATPIKFCLDGVLGKLEDGKPGSQVHQGRWLPLRTPAPPRVPLPQLALWPGRHSPLSCRLSVADVSAFSTSFFMLNRRDFKLLFSSRDLSNRFFESS